MRGPHKVRRNRGERWLTLRSNLRRSRSKDALLAPIKGAQNKNLPARAAGTSAVGASRAWHGLAAMKDAAVWSDKTDFAHRLSKVSFIP